MLIFKWLQQKFLHIVPLLFWLQHQQISLKQQIWKLYFGVACFALCCFYKLKSGCHRWQPKAKTWLPVSQNGCQWQPTSCFCEPCIVVPIWTNYQVSPLSVMEDLLLPHQVLTFRTALSRFKLKSGSLFYWVYQSSNLVRTLSVLFTDVVYSDFASNIDYYWLLINTFW